MKATRPVVEGRRSFKNVTVAVLVWRGFFTKWRDESLSQKKLPFKLKNLTICHRINVAITRVSHAELCRIIIPRRATVSLKVVHYQNSVHFEMKLRNLKYWHFTANFINLILRYCFFVCLFFDATTMSQINTVFEKHVTLVTENIIDFSVSRKNSDHTENDQKLNQNEKNV